MDELDKLKNHWKQNEPRFPQISEKEIYGMLHKKSSSIVRWILIISILEFVFQVGLTLLLNDNTGAQPLHNLNIDYIMIPMTVIGYGIILYFVYVFYMRYKKISATDNVKTLMANILNTRKAVSNYIYTNLAFIIVSFVVLVFVLFNTDPDLINAIQKSEANGEKITFYLTIFVFLVICIAIFIVLVWLFYRLLYGFLLKRLNRNYDELKKIDF
ncbi:hypothetical protein FMM05_15690 [Flavobacterium zepuense]|uniref:Beta-carotene 15,15'-monooxygenase n=1 Tax=Flavobacterium zepuense TaxID=2593302 RepID=A0A552UY49_9FLAO|nr:hypothetical protein [Flavobacterium zepuense]TRW23132.1 hypothetical protein FMM05_15690 [Flavobacterium zepuense]